MVSNIKEKFKYSAAYRMWSDDRII
jgi:hypothetical protein